MNSNGKYMETNQNEVQRFIHMKQPTEEKLMILREGLFKDSSAFENGAKFNAPSVQVNQLKGQNMLLKQLIEELRSENYLLKKCLAGRDKTAV